jgi:predicted RNase H-like HicB family nuclease
MNKYEIIIYWSEEDKAFIAEVPELAGCMAGGKTYQEAWQMRKLLSKNGLKRRKN